MTKREIAKRIPEESRIFFFFYISSALQLNSLCPFFYPQLVEQNRFSLNTLLYNYKYYMIKNVR